MLFASFILDREPMQWVHLPAGLILWVQNVGAVAALGLVIWVIAEMAQRRRAFSALTSAVGGSVGQLLPSLFTYLAIAAFLGYAAVAIIGAAGILGADRLNAFLPHVGQPGAVGLSVGDWILTISGAIALAIALTPIVHNLFRLRFSRIWALARLSLKEAIRNRVVIVFAAMALVFLFADWFVPYKPEDQLRNYVRVVYWSMAPLFLMTAGLLGALSIPADVKSQAIHTIVTKPVEKFEIVLGRFLGYGLLLTAGLAGIGVLSLGYVFQGVNEINAAAQVESGKARVPVFGDDLWFIGTRFKNKGDSVGREWEYRTYIGGPPAKPGMPRQYAVWAFASVPSDLADRTEPIRFEYTFDIYRLSKGEENKGIPCTFTFADGRLSPLAATAKAEQMAQERDKLQAQYRRQKDKALREATSAEARKQALEEYDRQLAGITETLIAEHGIYQDAGVEVTDYHTQTLDVPASLFKKLAEGRGADDAGKPALMVYVSVDHEANTVESQMLGVARRDLYLLANERPFWWNFLKGLTGLWCNSLFVLGVAIACSTYLSGIISWLCTMFVFGAGMFTDYLQTLTRNRAETGGGPTEAAFRLATNRQIAAPLDQSPLYSVLRGADDFFIWLLDRVLNLVPDVNRFDLHPYVANGFDISPMNLLLVDNLIPLFGYLLPWAILAFYLMKYREIANPT